MALFFTGQMCPLCEQPINEGPKFGTWGVWLPSHDPLSKYCDGVMHWDCYAAWPHRQQFASTYFQFWVNSEEQNVIWHRAYLDDDLLVTVNPFEPIKSTWVHLKETGSRIDVKLKDWETWLAAESGTDVHPVLAAVLDKAKRALRTQVPTSEKLVDAIDQSRKIKVVEQYNAAQKARRDAQREVQRQVNPYNAACNRLMKEIERDGLVCPHCGKHSKAYRLSKKPGQKSAVICTMCGWVVEPESAR